MNCPKKSFLITTMSLGLFFSGLLKAQTSVEVLRANKQSCSAYSIKGSNEFGQFKGVINIYDNVFAERNIVYSHKWMNRFSVEELWTGQVDSSGQITFKVKNHNFITSVGDEKLLRDDFNSTQTVTYQISKLGAKSECQPIFDKLDQRERIEIKENVNAPLLVQLGQVFIKKTVYDWYQKQAILDPYRNNEEFKKNQFFKVRDFTDFDFYQKNRNSLRIRNSITNKYTLNEAFLRNQAFAYSIDEKANLFDVETKKFNINEFGLYQYYFENGDKSKVPNYDSALWTGMYITSQVAKYRYMKLENSLKPGSFSKNQLDLVMSNIKTSLNGLFLLINIAKIEKQNGFARTAWIDDGKTDMGNNRAVGAQSEQLKSKKIYYIPGANNDMIKGFILAFANAYKIFPESDEIYPKLVHAVQVLKNTKLQRMSGLNNVYLAGLDAIYNKNMDSYLEFLQSYLKNQQLLSLVDLDAQFYLKGIADWSGINLSMVGSLSFIEIAKTLNTMLQDKNNKLSQDWVLFARNVNEGQYSSEYLTYTRQNGVSAKWILDQQYKTLEKLYDVFKNTKRDYLCLANYSYKVKSYTQIPTECFDSLNEIPVRVPEEAIEIDHTLASTFVVSPTPILPWKYWEEKETRNNPNWYRQSNTRFPIFEGDIMFSPMLWLEKPFNISASKKAHARLARVDFLFSYWMSKYQLLENNICGVNQATNCTK